MKKALKKITKKLYYYKNGLKIIVESSSDLPNNLYGDISGLHGYISSDLHGYITGLYGCITGLRGCIDKCDLTNEERKKGVKIEDLVNDEPDEAAPCPDCQKPEPGEFDFVFRGAYMNGWKAALGWIYDRLGHSQEHKQIKDIIEEELNNTPQ